jgi:MFS family permease
MLPDGEDAMADADSAAADADADAAGGAWRVTASPNPPYGGAALPVRARSWLDYGVPAVIGRVRVPGTLPGVQVFFLVFLPFALGHYVSSLLRNVNAILAPQMMAELALTPAQLGLLTSAYFFSFALVQLPVGMALDRYGPRRVQFLMLCVAAAGALAFAGSRELDQLLLARALMGAGLAGCFMAAVKSISTWISPARLPSVQGYLIAAGGLGAASATLPVRLALHYVDWRWLFIALAGCCAIIALLIYLLAPTPTEAQRKPQRMPMRRMLAEVYAHPVFRETACLVLVPHAVFFGIQGLWIARWLNDVAHFDQQAIAWLLYLGMAAVIFGAISVGMITEWAARKNIAPLSVAAAGIALYVAIQCGFVLDWAPSYQLLSVLFTLAGTITGIEYAIVAQAMPPGLTGRASTCLNLLIFLGAFAVQAGFGAIVGLWRPDLLQHYPAIAYRTAFGVLVLLQAAGLIRFLMRRRGAAARSGKMAAINSKEDYETGSLRPSRQREARPD